jgi:formyltetrahydrofolate deformylase
MGAFRHSSSLQRVAKQLGDRATLRVLGPDRKGIVAACSDLLNRHGCSIVSSEHYTDYSATPHSMLFQRILFDPEGLRDRSEVKTKVQELERKFGVKTKIDWRDKSPKVAVLVSKHDHCLWELLLRQQAKELDCEIPLIISNHENLRHVADTFQIPYYVFPVTPETKLEQEQAQLALIEAHDIDVIVLARYMQVLSKHFLSRYADSQIINIHHSFLPAFLGGRAYHQAHDRGVKLIGATAHYATLDLDQGPIIAQDVVAVSHRDGPHDFVRKGRGLERNVLVRALQAHLDQCVLVYNNKCVVFSD